MRQLQENQVKTAWNTHKKGLLHQEKAPALKSVVAMAAVYDTEVYDTPYFPVLASFATIDLRVYEHFPNEATPFIRPFLT